MTPLLVMVFFLMETKFWLQALKKDYMQKCFGVLFWGGGFAALLDTLIWCEMNKWNCMELRSAEKQRQNSYCRQKNTQGRADAGVNLFLWSLHEGGGDCASEPPGGAGSLTEESCCCCLCRKSGSRWGLSELQILLDGTSKPIIPH